MAENSSQARIFEERGIKAAEKTSCVRGNLIAWSDRGELDWESWSGVNSHPMKDERIEFVPFAYGFGRGKICNGCM